MGELGHLQGVGIGFGIRNVCSQLVTLWTRRHLLELLLRLRQLLHLQRQLRQRIRRRSFCTDWSGAVEIDLSAALIQFIRETEQPLLALQHDGSVRQQDDRRLPADE